MHASCPRPVLLAGLLALFGCNADPDEDGITTGIERSRGTNPHNADTDADGISDLDEIDFATDPLLADTDGDGLRDGTEVDLSMDPTSSDSDADGLLDMAEIALGTNPNARDTDRDDINDEEEVNRGTSATRQDTDSDGLTDGEELVATTDPLNADTDADGLRDGDEATFSTNPLNADTDSDGFTDGREYRSGSDGTDRYSWDFDGGVWPNRAEIAATKLRPTGSGLGDVLDNITMVDQFNQYVDLHQFFGYVIRLDLLWAGDATSEEIAMTSQADWIGNRDRGYITIHAMFRRGTVTKPIDEVIPEWVKDYGLEFPVIAGAGPDPDLDDRFEAEGLFDGNDALTLLIDRKMVLQGAWSNGNFTGFDDRVDELLQR